jgi:fibronectin-binding autotransporter adhesin
MKAMKREQFRCRFSLAATAVMILAAGSVVTQASAATNYWNGVDPVGSWGSTTNWSTDSGATTPNPAAVPGAEDDVVFNITTVNTDQNLHLNNADRAARSLTFNSTAPVSIARATSTGTTTRKIQLGGGGLTMNAGAGAVSFSSGSYVEVHLATSTFIANHSASTLSLPRPTVAVADLSSITLTLNGSGSGLTDFGHEIRDGANTTLAVDINTTGGGVTLVRDGDSTFSGGLTLKKGILASRSSNSLGAGTFTINGGAFGSLVSTRSYGNNLIINGNFQLGGVTLSGLASSGSTFNGDVDLGGGTRTITLGQSAIFNGALSNGGLTLVANPTSRVLTLGTSSVSTYTGPTTLSNGTLRVDGSLGDTAVTVVGGLLELTHTNALSSATTLDIRSGAEVRLSFAGTNVIHSLTVNGELQKRGVYAAGSLPGLTGTAGAYLQTLMPPPKGTLVSFL